MNVMENSNTEPQLFKDHRLLETMFELEGITLKHLSTSDKYSKYNEYIITSPEGHTKALMYYPIEQFLIMEAGIYAFKEDKLTDIFYAIKQSLTKE